MTYAEIRTAVRRADSRGPFADLNHVFGVLAEEIAELLDEIREGDIVEARAELVDLIGAAIKAVDAIDAGRLR